MCEIKHISSVYPNYVHIDCTPTLVCFCKVPKFVPELNKYVALFASNNCIQKVGRDFGVIRKQW